MTEEEAEEQRDFLRHLRAWMRAAGVNQKELATRIGVSQATISQWLAGNTAMSVRRLPRIAASLGIMPEQLQLAPPDDGDEPLAAAKEIGARLRAMRVAAGLSQTAAAERLGCHFTALSKWESGKNRLSLETMERLAQAYGVDPRELLGEAEETDIASKPRRAPMTVITRAFRGRGLTDAHVAGAIGVTPQCVSAWRTGRNRINAVTAKRINAQFGVPLHVMRPDVWAIGTGGEQVLRGNAEADDDDRVSASAGATMLLEASGLPAADSDPLSVEEQALLMLWRQLSAGDKRSVLSHIRRLREAGG